MKIPLKFFKIACGAAVIVNRVRERCQKLNNLEKTS
eukprot:UN02415